MDKKAQEKLMKLFKDYNVESDLLDYNALWDNNITNEENLAKIEEDIKILSESKEFEKKVEGDFKRKKKSIKQEKEEIDKNKLIQINEEIKYTQTEFKKSLETLEKNNSVLEKLYYIPKEYIKVIVDKGNEIYGLIFTGKAGTSKSFSTIQTLNELKTEYIYFSGYTTPLGLYGLLYNNREKGKTIVFDDTFGILNNNTSITLMLNALYSNAGKRKIEWSSSKLKELPSQFLLESNVILITNEIPKNIGKELISSRCLAYEFKFNNFEMLSIMKAIANLPHKSLEKKERHEIIKFIEMNIDETSQNFDLRIQNKIENLYLYSKEKWKELSMPLLNTKNEKLLLLKQFIQSSNTLQEAKNKWSETTGLSERAFQRYNLKLKETTIRHK